MLQSRLPGAGSTPKGICTDLGRIHVLAGHYPGAVLVPYRVREDLIWVLKPSLFVVIGKQKLKMAQIPHIDQWELYSVSCNNL